MQGPLVGEADEAREEGEKACRDDGHAIFLLDRECEKTSREPEADKEDEGQWSDSLGFHRLLADALDCDNAYGECCEIVGIAESC
jgi:hypothetical protein